MSIFSALTDILLFFVVSMADKQRKIANLINEDGHHQLFISLNAKCYLGKLYQCSNLMNILLSVERSRQQQERWSVA